MATPAPDRPDRFAAARAVADAVLYEGYVLYPYRASATKNQMRWQFGVIVPPACAVADTTERSSLRTECVIEAGEQCRLSVRVRGLQVQHRRVEAFSGDTLEPSWDEAVEHEIDLLPSEKRDITIQLAGGEEVEELRDDAGVVVGRVVRRREQVDARIRVEISAVPGSDCLITASAVIENITGAAPGPGREEVVRHSLVAVHVLWGVDDGEFISLLEPPDHAAGAVKSCRNEGLFPVLVSREVMLSSPIILYDFPAVAPESGGDMFDATEIDEILALRVLTLTDDEKAEARATDPRAAAIIDRCDAMSPDDWSRLHGQVRPVVAPGVAWWEPGADAGVDPTKDSVIVGGVEVSAGTRVVLRPSRRADAHDLFLAGMAATVTGVFNDVDGAQHVAVSLDADPAAEVLAWQGRYLYFHPEELEVVT